MFPFAFSVSAKNKGNAFSGTLFCKYSIAFWKSCEKSLEEQKQTKIKINTKKVFLYTLHFLQKSLGVLGSLQKANEPFLDKPYKQNFKNLNFWRRPLKPWNKTPTTITKLYLKSNSCFFAKLKINCKQYCSHFSRI